MAPPSSRRGEPAPSSGARRQSAEELYRRIVQTSIEGIWVLDEDDSTTFVNERMARMLGYEPGEMLGRSVYDFMDDEVGRQTKRELARRREGVSERVECRCRAKDGSDVWTLLAASPLIDDSGRYGGALAMVADISEQKRVEREVAASHQRLQAIVDNTPSIIYVRSLRFRFLLVNRAFEQAFAVRAGDIVGQGDETLLSPELLARVRINDHRLIDGGQPVTYEEDVPLADDGERTFLTVKFLLPDAQGLPAAISCISTDITERKGREEELRLRLEWEQRIRRAVDNAELIVYSQPIVELTTGKMHHEELLVRMRGTRGADDVIPPGDFLPQAERFGLITEIDLFMIDQAVALAARGRTVAINVSGRSLGDRRLLDELEERLEATEQTPAA